MVSESTLVASVFYLLGLASLAYANQFTVVVGGSDTDMFQPQFVSANSGDTVQFVFSQTGDSYSVTQSSFDHPCQKLTGGFDSGLVPGPAQAPVNNIDFPVNSSQPTWFYSEFHCKSGMVFAINPGSNFTTFQQIAMGLVGSSTTLTTVTDTATVVVSGQGTTTSTLVSLSLLPTATAKSSSKSNGAGWVTHPTIILMIGMSFCFALQLMMYFPLWRSVDV